MCRENLLWRRANVSTASNASFARIGAEEWYVRAFLPRKASLRSVVARRIIIVAYFDDNEERLWCRWGDPNNQCELAKRNNNRKSSSTTNSNGKLSVTYLCVRGLKSFPGTCKKR